MTRWKMRRMNADWHPQIESETIHATIAGSTVTFVDPVRTVSKAQIDAVLRAAQQQGSILESADKQLGLNKDFLSKVSSQFPSDTLNRIELTHTPTIGRPQPPRHGRLHEHCGVWRRRGSHGRHHAADHAGGGHGWIRGRWDVQRCVRRGVKTPVSANATLCYVSHL